VKGNVLVIEDEKELADLIALYLGKDGIVCTICPDAETGLASLEKNRFDLVTLDINLPGMDGFEFLSSFRKSHRIPVIIVSAREADGDITTVGVYIQRLRKKIEQDPLEPAIIQTIHGKGYRFNDEYLSGEKR